MLWVVPHTHTHTHTHTQDFIYTGGGREASPPLQDFTHPMEFIITNLECCSPETANTVIPEINVWSKKYELAAFEIKSYFNKCCTLLALFPGPAQLSIAIGTESGRGPGIFSHMSDVRIERMVERV